MTYRERRQARADRLRGWAEQRQERAAATFKANEPYTTDIAFNTQPGHIPMRARIIAQEDRAFRSLQKADGMASHADGIERQLDTAIYSDDADALERLRERIASLEAERERIKAYNASCRKGTPNTALLDPEQQSALASCLRFQGYACKGGAFPAYVLSNLSGNIKRQRDRLTELSAPPRRSVRFLYVKYAGSCGT